MGLATYRHNETGELIELSEDWLTRFPKDPYTPVGTDELAKLEIEQRQAAAEAAGAQPYQQPEDAAAEQAAPTPPAAPSSGGKGDSTDPGDTPPPSGNPRSETRF